MNCPMCSGELSRIVSGPQSGQGATWACLVCGMMTECEIPVRGLLFEVYDVGPAGDPHTYSRYLRFKRMLEAPTVYSESMYVAYHKAKQNPEQWVVSDLIIHPVQWVRRLLGKSWELGEKQVAIRYTPAPPPAPLPPPDEPIEVVEVDEQQEFLQGLANCFADEPDEAVEPVESEEDKEFDFKFQYVPKSGYTKVEVALAASFMNRLEREPDDKEFFRPLIRWSNR